MIGYAISFLVQEIELNITPFSNEKGGTKALLQVQSLQTYNNP